MRLFIMDIIIQHRLLFTMRHPFDTVILDRTPIMVDAILIMDDDSIEEAMIMIAAIEIETVVVEGGDKRGAI
jgi:hypothetical protein